MEQFDLSVWLKDKSRKICTRDGRPVRIVCWDCKNEQPIIVLTLEPKIGIEIPRMYSSNGVYNLRIESSCDLFFADEEERLTELQETLEEDCDFYVSLYNDGKTREELIEWIKGWCPRIIDLARKELEEEVWRNPVGAYKNGYEQGKADTLEDLPKWKKAKKDEELDCHVAIQQDDRVVLSDFVQKDEYYITLDVLKKLQKEE